RPRPTSTLFPYTTLFRSSAPAVRKPLEESAAAVRCFLGAHEAWVVEGCYGDLLERVLPSATEVRFLNPGIEVCVANCRARPWERSEEHTSELQSRFDLVC